MFCHTSTGSVEGMRQKEKKDEQLLKPLHSNDKQEESGASPKMKDYFSKYDGIVGSCSRT